jgi:CBS domain-containing protein
MHRFLEATVRDYMTPDVVAVSPDAPLARLEEILAERGFHGVPVVDGGVVVGIATALDVLEAYRFRPEHMVPAYDDLARTPVARIMTAPPVTVGPETPLTRVLETLLERRAHSLPVVAAGRLVGMISRGDLVRALGDAAAPSR